ncbi:MAG: hypothetical protein SV186_04400 [Candidatus Nanohaloarchaea archaeon]|nr:hypothetical protein [Candidatus Nanohaloarchaea archaeon]
MNRKFTAILAAFLAVINTALAHGTGDQGDYSHGMMWSDGSWMHNGAHMMGYNMWGMGWFGVIPGLIFWALALLGAYHLYQRFTAPDDE